MSIDLEGLGRKIKAAQHRQHRVLDAALAPLGTTIVQWDALRAIGARPAASGHELALATFQTDQAFGTLANRLEAQGLIERRAGEGRRIDHRLTPAGAMVLDAANEVASYIRVQLFASLTDTECATLQVLLDKLLADAKSR
ncbi:MarR family winged helix-turn-helix transcriptional regulator [Asticcacaulis sp. 201]|uniref:MarR family winged helix-turn-helix transcriptional regulator n=1 Tax=Asticcacaulis sp. 201 TaxID=3028787 RepID=UPI002915D93C|nr:MarR family transcriptional regulator [Asticcacaulis sp. 201]MDV6330413.1 MarR family transcriptional regulator [Asticcacaulis sp. 201]